MLTGGRVVVPGAPPPEAVLIRGGTVVATGTDDEIRARAADLDARRPEQEIRLDGRLVTPTFTDAHLHAVQAGQVAAGLDLHGVPRPGRAARPG